MGLFDRHSLLVRVKLENQLFQIQEGLLVSGALSYLHHTLPVVLGLDSLTLVTDLIDHLELDNARLLQNCAAQVFLARELDLDALGMRLGPYETGVHETQLVEALDTLEAEREQLSRLQACLDPGSGRLQVAFTLATELEQTLLGKLVRDVGFRLDTLHASVKRVLIDEHTALAAQTFEIK
jgi:hypothetical protein